MLIHVHWSQVDNVEVTYTVPDLIVFLVETICIWINYLPLATEVNSAETSPCDIVDWNCMGNQQTGSLL